MCIWYVSHEQLCTMAKLMGLIFSLRSHCLFAWCSDSGIKLIPCVRAHCEICAALQSPLSLTHRGFKKCVPWGMACMAPVNRVAHTRKSFSKEALLFCQVNVSVIYFPAHIAKLMLIKPLKHTTEQIFIDVMATNCIGTLPCCLLSKYLLGKNNLHYPQQRTSQLRALEPRASFLLSWTPELKLQDPLR